MEPRRFQWFSRLLSLGIRHEQVSSIGETFQQAAWVRKLLKETKKRSYHLHTPLHEILFILLDTETTGFSPQRGDEIFSIAATKTKNGERLDHYGSHIRPKRPIPTHVVALTGITNEQVANAPSLEEEIQTILSFFEHGILLGYHIQHDIAFLNEFLSRNYRTVLAQRSLEMRRIIEALHRRSFPTFDEALSFYGIHPFARHTADGDVRSLFELWQIVFEELKQRNMETLHDLYALLSQH
jgi:DNA polymerase-3 subunit epsilon